MTRAAGTSPSVASGGDRLAGDATLQSAVGDLVAGGDMAVGGESPSIFPCYYATLEFAMVGSRWSE